MITEEQCKELDAMLVKLREMRVGQTLTMAKHLDDAIESVDAAQDWYRYWASVEKMVYE